MYCRAIIRPIPGTPRTPEISAVSGLIDMFIPIKPPTRFTAASIKPPKTLFMPSLKIHFSGLIKIQHKRYTSISPTAYAMIDIPSNSIKNHSPARRAAGIGRRRTLNMVFVLFYTGLVCFMTESSNLFFRITRCRRKTARRKLKFGFFPSISEAFLKQPSIFLP